MEKSAAIISDIHLCEDNKIIADSFIHYIDTIAPKHESVYIIGDLFEFWVGDDNNSNFNQNIMNKLKKLSKTTKLYFQAGNRDFLVGSEFCEKTGCTFLPDIYTTKIHGKKILLTHGDLLLTKDIEYQKFRRFIQNELTKKIFLKIPLKYRIKIAANRRKKSTHIVMNTDNNKFIVDDKLIKKLSRENDADLFVFGHIHKTSIKQNNNYNTISIPDWKNDNHSIELVINNDGTVELKRHKNK